MGARVTTEGLAALCLAANGFVASSFRDERLKDGRIREIVADFEDGQHVVRVLSGHTSYCAKGTSRVSSADAESQALQVFCSWELSIRRPGDLVTLGELCF